MYILDKKVCQTSSDKWFTFLVNQIHWFCLCACWCTYQLQCFHSQDTNLYFGTGWNSSTLLNCKNVSPMSGFFYFLGWLKLGWKYITAWLRFWLKDKCHFKSRFSKRHHSRQQTLHFKFNTLSKKTISNIKRWLPFKYFSKVRTLFTFNLTSQQATSDKTNKGSSFFEFQLKF